MVQFEPWMERDRAMIDPLKSLGIEKGKPFKPDAKTTEILKSAAEEALALFDMRYETGYEPHNEGKHWFLPADKRSDRIGQTASARPKSIRPTDAGYSYTSPSTTSSTWARASSISSSSATRTAIRSTAPQPIACTCRRSRP